MIPVQFTLDSLTMGPAILLVGLLAVTLWAAVQFRNPAGVIAWGFSILLYIFSGLFNVGIELFWVGMILTVILLVIGVVARWSQ